MSLAIGIYNELRRIGAALTAAIAGVDGKVADAVNNGITVADQVGSVGNAVATLQDTANTISSKVTAINEAGGTKGIKAVQRGVVYFGTDSLKTITITAVDPAKTELRLLGWTGSGAASPVDGATVELASATSIKVGRNGNSGPNTVSWELTEWN